jgi:hypothetical protein
MNKVDSLTPSLRSALTGNELLDVARERWDRCQEYESDFRKRFIEDVQFANADSDNNWQWPDTLRTARDAVSKPCLTINVVRQHNLMIANGLRRNKSSVRVVGVGNGATAESASVFRDLIRRIEYQSQAQASVYAPARKWQVDGGIGWIRVATDYAGDDTFDQEVFLKPVLDPLAVYVDPDCKMHDCSDAKFLFAFDRMLPEELDELYPDQGPWEKSPLQVSSETLEDDDRCIVLEYFVRVPKEDGLVSFVGPNGKRATMKRSQLEKMQGHESIMDDPLTKVRSIAMQEVRRYFIVGNRAVGEDDDEEDDEGNPYQVWVGERIPFVPVKGEEINFRGRLDRKGHTRAMKDAQRMFNYNASSQVEHIAMQGKTPWTGAVDAFAGLENYWNKANTTNIAWLPFRHKDSEGDDIPPQALPQRVQPPVTSPAYADMMDRAFNWLMMSSGQWQNQMGMMGNERTGEAIKQRQDQSDTSTYHFQDNYEAALQSLGRILIDVIPKVYDTQRMLKVVAEDGVEKEIEINPGARMAYFQDMDHRGEVVRRVFNPTVGKYDVAATVGPEYGTKRDESRDAMTLILTQAPALTNVIGDLLLKSMDFDEAQEAAQRLKRMVPPAALGQGPTPQEQQMQQTIAALQAALAKSLERQGKDQLKLVGKDQMRDIDVYKAETDRMKVLAPMAPQEFQTLIQSLVQEALDTQLAPIIQANREGVEQESVEAGDKQLPEAGQSPASGNHPSRVPGARQAPDGQWYVKDPTGQSKYLHIAPKGQGVPA